MWVSSDNGASFQKAEFPITGHTNWFTVIDASEGGIMLAAEHIETIFEGWRGEGGRYVDISSGSISF